MELRIQASHEPSGNVLSGVVIGMSYEKDREPSYQVIPDGLLEVVVIRGSVWQVREIRDKSTA